MSYFRAIALIALNDLKVAVRDRSTILWLFIMPVVFMGFIGAVTQGGVGFTTTAVELVVENHDEGFLAEHFEQRLGENLFTVIAPEDLPMPEEGEEPEEYRTVTIPEGFTASLQAGEPVTVSYRGRQQGFANEYDLFRVEKAALTALADVVVIKAGGADAQVTPETLADAIAAPRPTELAVTPAGRQMQIPTGFQQSIPGILVMFTLLVLLTTGAAMLVDDRNKMLLRRLASAPFTRGQVVFGKWAGRMVLAVVQITVAMAWAGAFVLLSPYLLDQPIFGAGLIDALPMIMVILLAWGAACTSLALLLGSVARTDNQAAGLGVFATMVLAALGGCWWPIEVAPKWMQAVQLYLPSGWTMDAMHKLISFGDGAASVLPHLAALVLATLAFGWLAAKRFRFV